MSTIWEQCASKEWCLKVPFDGDRCFSVTACVRVLQEGATFFLEIEAGGNRERMRLADACIETRYYVFAAKACAANVKIQAHTLDFDIVIKLCIDVDLGPIGHIQECVDVYSQHVVIGFYTDEQLAAVGLKHPAIAGDASSPMTPAHIELNIPEERLAKVRAMF